MSEIQRYQLLARREGKTAAIEREKFYADRYLAMAERAIKPREEKESLNFARGKEWGKIFYMAHLECLAVIELAEDNHERN